MTIAINANQHPHSVSNGFYLQFLIDGAAAHPEHQFILIGSNSIAELENIPSNILSVISAPLVNNSWMWKHWLSYTLPGIIKINNAGIPIAGKKLGAIPNKYFIVKFPPV